MNRTIAQALALIFAGATSIAQADTPTLKSGIDMSNFDTSVRAQDDFYGYVNGGWLKRTEIPADKPAWGAFDELHDMSIQRVHNMIEAMKSPTGAQDADAVRIRDLYASFMNEARVEELGSSPLKGELARIEALNDKAQIPALMAHLNRISVTVPFSIGVHQDAKDPSRYVVDFGQDGLGLPDRDYYLKTGDKQLHEAYVKYVAYIEKLLTLHGDTDAKAKAKRIVALETEIARIQWNRVDSRDAVKTYNPTPIAKLTTLSPAFDWQNYLDALGTKGKVDSVILSQPDYFSKFSALVARTPLDTWKTYFAWHMLNDYAPFLNKAMDEESFAFNETVLLGTPQQEPRWKRAVRLEDRFLGEAVGKRYVDQHFSPEAKARVEKLVANLLKAFDQSLDTLDWMGPETRKEAHAKIATFAPKIGYPNKWRDYSSLVIDPNDLVGNVMRGNEFRMQHSLNKLGRPVDRDEWLMSPQTVNAYYNPELNEIVFPAAILQPPFFNAEADDAVNYGSIGAVIGHEISHGFDDQGAKYDGKGVMRDWWSKRDAQQFAKKSAMLVKQYGRYEPVPGHHVNGKLTLGENIADNSGLTIAYKAYQMSLGKETAPVIDGLSGDQRFFLGYEQVWRGKLRDQFTIQLITTNPHAPDGVRGNGTVVNQDAFYRAFDVKPGDKMYVAPKQRVHMW